MKRILITGISGFIGNNFYNYLKEKKNVTIFGTIGGTKYNNKKILLKKNSLQNNILLCDLSILKNVKRLIKNINPDVIYHFAAMTDHSFAEKNKLLCQKYNTGITNNILKSIKNKCILIFLSTDKIYSGNPKTSPENVNVKPFGFLAKEKLNCEKNIKKKTKKYFILRLPIVHKTGEDKRTSVIDKFIYSIKKNKKIYVFRNVIRSFLKIDELNIFLFNIIKSKKYGIYNVGSKLFSYSARIKNLCKINNIAYKKKIIEIDGNVYPLKQNFNTQKIKKNFNFQFS